MQFAKLDEASREPSGEVARYSSYSGSTRVGDFHVRGMVPTESGSDRDASNH